MKNPVSMAKMHSAFTSADLFRQGVSFRMSKDQETQGTVIGTIFSLVIFILTVPFLISQWVTLWDYQG